MLTVKGKCHIDSIEIGEVSIDLIVNKTQGAQFPGIVMNVKYALGNSKNGARLGAGTRSLWGEAVQEKLRELMAAMENEIAADVFEQTLTTDSGGETLEQLPPDVPQL